MAKQMCVHAFLAPKLKFLRASSEASSPGAVAVPVTWSNKSKLSKYSLVLNAHAEAPRQSHIFFKYSLNKHTFDFPK